jgi:hypothetical protein
LAFAQARPYAPKNGILNWRAILLGGGFRVTTAIPLHGDFSKYSRVEITRPESDIGSDVPAGVLDQLARGLVEAFLKGGHMADATIVEAASLRRVQPESTPDAPATESSRAADTLDAPMRTRDDMLAFDRARHAAASVLANATLVVRCEVIDYAKGHRLLQLLPIDRGNSVLTLRFSFYDKGSGEELGRSVVSSDNSSKVIPSAFTSRTALIGVISGLVDQVTRRKIAGER